MNKPTVVSLFSGAGGGDLGFEQAGLDVIYSCDIDPICKETYDYNFSGVMRPYSVESLAEQGGVPDCDVLIGGPPCQSFSTLRVRNKLNCSGLTNVYAMQKIAATKQPKVVVCENVASILKLEGMAPVFNEFKMGFDNAGYHVDAYIFNTQDYGIPQDRDRAFFICIRKDLYYYKNIRFYRPEGRHWRLDYEGWADYLDIDRDAYYCARASNVAGRKADQPTFTVTGAEWPVIRYSYGDVMRGNQIATLRHNSLGVSQRYLTMAELKKLQGFPPEFKVMGNVSDVRRQVGNAWSVPVAKAIGCEIKRIISK